MLTFSFVYKEAFYTHLVWKLGVIHWDFGISQKWTGIVENHFGLGIRAKNELGSEIGDPPPHKNPH